MVKRVVCENCQKWTQDGVHASEREGGWGICTDENVDSMVSTDDQSSGISHRSKVYVKKGFGCIFGVNRDTQIVHNGKAKSMREWAKEYGIPPSTLQERLANGWTTEMAIETPPKNHDVHRVCGEMISLAEAARRYDISPSTLHGRMKRGMSLAQAISKSGINLSEEKDQ